MRTAGSEWTTADIAILALLHGKMRAREIGEKIGRSTRAVQSKAFEIGLTKGNKNG